MARPSVSMENRDSLVVLDQRVRNLEQGISTHSRNVETRFTTLQADFDNHFQILNEKLDRREDRRWVWAPAIAIASLVLVTIGGLGTLSILPIKDDVIRNRADLQALHTDYIERDRRIWDHVLKTKAELDFFRGQLHPIKP